MSFSLLGDIHPSVSLCIYLPVIRNDKDYILSGDETVPNDGCRRIIHSMPSLLLGHSEIHQLVVFACHFQLFFICAFSCTYFPFHINSRPAFHTLFCQVSEAWPKSWYSVPCCLLTDIAHISVSPDHNISFIAGENPVAGFSLVTCLMTESWLTCPNSCTQFRDLLRTKLLVIWDSST